MTITSLANATVKLLASLRLEKYRAEHGLFLVEGARNVEDGVAAGARLKILAVTEDAPATTNAAESTIVVTPDVMGKIAHKDNPQAVAGAFARDVRAFADVKPGQGDIFVALDRIRDPGNLGTIIRTAHAVKAVGVLLIGASCDPTAPECVRATTGSIFHVPVYEGSEADFTTLARAWPGSVVGTAASSSVHYRKANYKAPVLLVLGTEQSGLSAEVAAACRENVHIPMPGGTESLNVAVAAALALYGVRETL